MCPTWSFALFHSNILVQALSNGIFWLKESDFGLDKWCQACFCKKLPPKPESSIQLKSFILRRFLRGILHKKGWPANPDAKSIWNFSLFKVRLGKFILSAPLVHISNGKKCSHQSQNPKFSWKSAFLTASVLERTSSFDCLQRLWTLKDFPFETFVLPCFSRFSMVGDPSNITLSTAYPRQNWHDALSWDWIYIQLFIWNSKFIQSFKPCVS